MDASDEDVEADIAQVACLLTARSPVEASEIGNNFYEIVDGNMELRVGPANKETYTPSGAYNVSQGIGSVAGSLGEAGSKPGIGDLTISVEKSKTQVVGKDHFEKISDDKETKVGKDYTAKVGKKMSISAGDETLLTCGQSRIKLTSDGTNEINGMKILEKASSLVRVQSSMIKLN